MRELTGQIPLRCGQQPCPPLALRLAGGDTHEDPDLLVACLGDAHWIHPDVLHPLQFINARRIHDLYRAQRESLATALGGLFVLVILDKARKRLFVIPDPSSFPLNVYYVVENGSLFFSTSYKNLLLSSKVPRKWNESARRLFLQIGFLPCGHTLLENVNKLLPGQFLDLDLERGELRIRPSPKPARPVGVLFAIANYRQALRNVIASELERIPDINATLSSGYDTNLILHLIRETTDRKCLVFTIGGQRGRNEAPRTKQIAAQYPNVTHRVATVDSHALERFPDIVWRLEGAVYEAGVFLQYELARLVKRDNGASLICGECADQVLSPKFSRPSPKLLETPTYERNPHEMGLMLVYKKNGILLNSFSIKTLYPYLNQNFVDVASRVAFLNGTRKRFHKWLVSRCVKKEVAALLGKMPGATTLDALFEDDTQTRRLKEKIKPTEDFQWLMAKRRGKPYRTAEGEMDAILRVVYLSLFETLIRSGDYDRHFAAPGLDLPLTEALQ